MASARVQEAPMVERGEGGGVGSQKEGGGPFEVRPMDVARRRWCTHRAQLRRHGRETARFRAPFAEAGCAQESHEGYAAIGKRRTAPW